MIADYLSQFATVICPELLATLEMTVLASAASLILSILLGIVLVVTDENGLNPNKFIYKPLSFIINVIRSFPIIILIIIMIPVTRFLVGSAIGVVAACVPLTIAATAFISRMFEVNFREVDNRLIEAAKALGLTKKQIVRYIIIRESVPSVVQTATTGIISILSATTIAGIFGAGGLGAIAISYGYQSFNTFILVTTVALIIVMVQTIQFIGNLIYHKIK